MALIGMLHNGNKPHGVRKAYACAAVAKLEGHEFFYFSIKNVDLAKKTIIGWLFESGEWKKRVMPFPDVIYNASGPRTEEQKNVYRTLKQMIPFTSFSVGNKVNVYQKIKKGKDFSDFLIPYKEIKSFKTISQFIDTHQKIVIKPFSGSKGREVYFLEKIGESYTLFDGIREVIIEEEKLKNFYEKYLQDKKFLVQKYILSITKTGFPYDFRIHMQKGTMGDWNINRIYPRISVGNKPINNISSGGFRGDLDVFLVNEYGVESENIKKYLEQFATMFTPHFEEQYDKCFDELGIDVGLDKDHKIWIYEVNWRPGSKTRELDFARHQILYAAYLVEKIKGNKNKLEDGD